MKVQTYINEGPGMFWGYEPGDKLVLGPVVETVADEIKRITDLDILDGTVWHVGNRMMSDVAGNPWPSNVRSLSVGDVAVVGETAYAVASIGWKPIPTEHLTWSLDPERQISNTRLEEARAR